MIEELEGYERWCIKWYLLGDFFGIIFSGEIWNWGKGGLLNGFVSLWVVSFFVSFWLIICGFCCVDNKLGVIEDIWGFLK